MIDLRLGDCLALLEDIPDGTIDLVCADIPYGTTKCKWDSPLDITKLWAHYLKIGKPTTAYVLFCGEPFTSTLIQSNLKLFTYKKIWDKEYAGNFVTANIRPLNVFEEIAIFYGKQCTYNPQMVLRDKPITSGKRCHPRNRTGVDNGIIIMPISLIGVAMVSGIYRRRECQAEEGTEPIPEGKVCLACGTWKPLDHFRRQAVGKYGRRSRCKNCTRGE